MPWIFDNYEQYSNTQAPVSFWGKLKYKDLLFLQRNNDGSHTTVMASLQLEPTFLSLLTKAQTIFFTVELFYSLCLAWFFEMGSISFHNTLLGFLCKSIDCNGPRNRHLQYNIRAYLSSMECLYCLQCY